MDGDILIKCEGLSKKFCINQRKSMLYGGADVLFSMLGFPRRRDILRKHEIWALRDLNFEVKRGDTLGIIGVNGAGKSTLLRVLGGIYPPDAGAVYIKGPIGALISAGAGFHPDMTGRENIYLNGTIVGLKKKEIDRKLDEIIEFAEIGEFIDTPVRFYSSGMYVRLGFSIAVNIRPRILLIDEVLSVGDLTFQNKCLRKLKELRESVEGVLFVSHHLDHVRNICSDLIILNGGKIYFHGDVEEGVVCYQSLADEIKQRSRERESGRPALPGALSLGDHAQLEKIEISSREDGSASEICTGDDIVLKFHFKTWREIRKPQFALTVLDDRNTPIIWLISHDDHIEFDKLEAGEYQLKVIIRKPPLVAGIYRLDFGIREIETCEMLVKVRRFTSFRIHGRKFARAILSCDSNWSLQRVGEPTKVDEPGKG
ncbi:MAG: ABC transporter ATP-binding protein [Candidatus Abyssobacteria bacterium SURF_5]|uniref:ABC transporter ATP-binding protein n=1 Tax=Abyssobacteria bacterium (strain SURF_5) TaxID=2093360 RepID=A0A3A4NYC1_ABYX5|nr:MAG: ABC transporter ATP-binding protein [Candidatus Abyssubacteria bacterium SURF_5]